MNGNVIYLKNILCTHCGGKKFCGYRIRPVRAEDYDCPTCGNRGIISEGSIRGLDGSIIIEEEF